MANLLTRPYTSTVPAAIDALYEAWNSAFEAQLAAGGDRVYVRDGPWTAEQSGGSYPQDVAIGWYGFYPGYQYPTRSLSEELGEAAVSAHNETAGMAPSQQESYTIGCASLTMYGGEAVHANYSRLRHLAAANVATCAAAISDPSMGSYLNGASMRLVFAPETAYHMVPQRRGILVIVTFSVEGQAFSQQ